MDNEGTRSSSGIAFYAWDFAGQVFYKPNNAVTMITMCTGGILSGSSMLCY